MTCSADGGSLQDDEAVRKGIATGGSVPGGLGIHLNIAMPIESITIADLT